MRLYGYVTVDGVRVPLDWSVNGVTVESVGGLSADEVFVKVDLPKYVDDEGELLEEAVSEEVVVTEYSKKTVTELRVLLQERGLAIHGNKKDLIDRLVKDGSEDLVEEEEEVEEDASE